jgi:mannonate dehydratase
MLGSALCMAGLLGYPAVTRAGMLNPCRAGLPAELANHDLMHQAWACLDPAQVWDCHAHLVGVGDAASGAWANPHMDTLQYPVQFMQKRLYMNAACVATNAGGVDVAYVARVVELMAQFPAGARILLFAFDWAHDAQGRPLPELSAFHVPDAYAAAVAQAHPGRVEWVCSIHPYRADALDRLHAAAMAGARAVKWLPAAMGIDPAAHRCYSFYRAMASLGLPLIVHAGHEAAVAGTARQEFGNPLKLRPALELGVRVVVAHCASHGDDQDEGGKRRPSFELFADMMNSRLPGLYGDISAVTQINRAQVLEILLARTEWHDRLLNGSDYPLPGVVPLFSLEWLAHRNLLPRSAIPFLKQLRGHNALLFDFVLKRLLRRDGAGFPDAVFMTRNFFERRLA